MFKEVGSNIFTVSFTTKEDKVRVENGRPWLFGNHLHVLESFDGHTLPKDMKFDRASLWVHLYQLLPLGMNKIVGERVGKSLETVEVDGDDVGWGKNLRLRVCMDLTKPLARGRVYLSWGRSIGSPYVMKSYLKSTSPTGALSIRKTYAAQKINLWMKINSLGYGSVLQWKESIFCQIGKDNQGHPFVGSNIYITASSGGMKKNPKQMES